MQTVPTMAIEAKTEAFVGQDTSQFKPLIGDSVRITLRGLRRRWSR